MLPKKTTVEIIGFLIILSSVAVFAVGIYAYLNTRAFLKTAVKAQARVTGLKEISTDGTTRYAPVFSFVDNNGIKYTKEAGISSSPPKYNVGDSIAILYDVQNPEDARINSGIGLWVAVVISSFMGVISLVIGLCMVLQPRIVQMFIRD